MTNVKICGITSLADAELAAELEAWAIGLVFYEASPRACPPAEGEVIGAALKRRCEVVGVFRNETLERVADLADRCGLTILQLHGEEGPAYCAEAARRTGARVMKAARVRHAGAVHDLLDRYHTDYHLLDTWSPSLPGGTGETFDWELARLHDGRVPLALSGGLDPENVEEAITTVRPFAVDSASGTEAEPGRKDPQLVRAFVRAAARADEALVA